MSKVADGVSEKVLPSALARSARFLAGAHNGEVHLLDLQTRKRAFIGELALSDKIVGLEPFPQVLALQDRFVFVGVRKLSRQPLQVFDAGPVLGNEPRLEKVRPGRLELDFEAQGRQRGLAAIHVAQNDERCLELWIGTGRGIGRAYIWKMMISGGTIEYMRLCGSLLIHSSTLLAIAFSECGKRVGTIGAGDEFAEIWQIEELMRANDESMEIPRRHSKRVPLGDAERLEEELSSKERARIFLLDLNQRTVEDFLRTEETATWRDLFPPMLLDPNAYDGEVNAKGLPHGNGRQLFPEDTRYMFDGEWVDGKRQGVGQMIEVRNGKLIYIGGWKQDKRHGYGIEVKGGSTDVGEMYEGWWREGLRDGIGVLYFSKQASGLIGSAKTKERIRYVGSFRNGKQHGLGLWIWPAGSPLIPFRTTLESMRHLGSVRCVVQFKFGKFFDEFHFHRADGVEIGKDDEKLFNFPSSAADKFAGSPDGHWDREECWICMETGLKEGVLVCGNEKCQMRVHTYCLGKIPRRFPCTDIARQVFCEQLSEIKAEELRKFIRDDLKWFCPMPECQTLARSFPVDPDFRQEAAAEVPEVPPSIPELKKERTVKELNALIASAFERPAEKDPELQMPNDLDDHLFVRTTANGGMEVIFNKEDLIEALEETALRNQKTLKLHKISKNLQ